MWRHRWPRIANKRDKGCLCVCDSKISVKPTAEHALPIHKAVASHARRLGILPPTVFIGLGDHASTNANCVCEEVRTYSGKVVVVVLARVSSADGLAAN